MASSELFGYIALSGKREQDVRSQLGVCVLYDKERRPLIGSAAGRGW